MRYVEIQPGDENQVLRELSSALDESAVMSAVLSAVYSCSTEFAGETLLRHLISARGEHKIGLMRVVHTFMQMHRTDFLADSFVAEMMKDDVAIASYQSEVEDIIEGVLEYQEMFKGCSPRTSPSSTSTS